MISQPDVGRGLGLWRSRHAKFVRFGIVGGATAMLYAGTLAMLMKSGVAGTVSSTVVAYLIAVLFNYFMHHRYTFASNRPHRSSGPRFFITTAGNLMVVTVATAFLPDLLHVNFLWIQAAIFVIAALAAFVLQSTFAFIDVDK